MQKDVLNLVFRRFLLLLLLLIPIFSLLAPKLLTALLGLGGLISLWIIIISSASKRPPKLFFLLAAYLVWAGIVTALQGWDEEAGQLFLKSSLLVLAGFGYLAVAPTIQRQKLCDFFPYILSATAIGLAVDNTFNYPIFRAFRGFDWERTVGLAENNRSAVALAILLWPGLSMLRGNKAAQATLFFTVALPVIATGNSQSAVLGICAGAVSMIGTYLFPKRFPAAFIIVIMVGVLCSPWIARSLFDTKPSFLMERQEAAAEQRIYIWNAVTDKIMEKPLTGWGVEATRTTAKSVIENVGPYSKKWNEVYHPHNTALQVWLETGVIGVIIVLCFLWKLFLELRNIPENFAAFTTIISISLVGYGMWQAWWIALLFLSAIIVIITKNDSCKL